MTNPIIIVSFLCFFIFCLFLDGDDDEVVLIGSFVLGLFILLAGDINAPDKDSKLFGSSLINGLIVCLSVSSCSRHVLALGWCQKCNYLGLFRTKDNFMRQSRQKPSWF